jgi:hypothetical protein
VRGLQSTSRQLALPLEGRDPIHGMWESLGADAQERILRMLARAIAAVLSQQERQR